MHAYLVIGNNPANVKKIAEEKAESVGEILEFNIAKISDVRELGKLTKLTFKNPTSFLIENIDNATTEALNAFLKNLEEPQENVNYVLTAASEYSLLPTVVSRCQVIRTGSFSNKDKNNSLDFLNLTTSERLKVVSKIKNKNEARDFLKLFILNLHGLLTRENMANKLTVQTLNQASDSLKAVEGNANVGLQLTDFVVKMRAVLN